MGRYRINDVFHIGTQKRVDCTFDDDRAWQRRLALPSQGFTMFSIAVAYGVLRFGCAGEGEVGERIFVGAIHLCLVVETCQTPERKFEVGRRTLNEAPATCREKRITAKQHTVAEIGDMAACMSCHPDDLQFEFQGLNGYFVAVVHRMIDAGDIVLAWAVYRYPLIMSDNLADAAGVVAVVMGQQDGGEFKAVFFQRSKRGHGFTRIDQYRMAVIVDEPDVVVVAERYRSDVESGHGRTDGCIWTEAE